jgi:hypothetical protein
MTAGLFEHRPDNIGEADMYAVLSRVRIKPGHEQESLASARRAAEFVSVEVCEVVGQA